MAIATSGGISKDIAGGYVLTGAGTISGTGTTTLSVAALGDLTVAGAGTDITLSNIVQAGILYNIDVQNGAHLTVTGLAGVNVGSTYTIESGGKLTLGSGLSISAGQSVDFKGGTGTLEFQAPFTSKVPIVNFGSGSQLLIDGAVFDPALSSYSGGILHLVAASGLSVDVSLGTDGSAGKYFHVAYNTTLGADAITLDNNATGGIPACYARGTHILTGRGEVRVEDLVIGDLLVTASGALRPLKWIGQRSYAGRLMAGSARLHPVLIRQGALADGVPHRDLRVSPAHAMFIDGVLIPAASLVNGRTIVQQTDVTEVHYVHLELDTHDIIVAEGAASESYVEDDNRGIFHNAGSYAALYPEAVRCDAAYCAERVESGYVLEAARRRIAARAADWAALGAAPPRETGALAA